MKIVAKEGVTVRITIEPGKYIFVAGEPIEIDENNENIMSQVRWLLDSGLVKKVEEKVVEEGSVGEAGKKRKVVKKESAKEE